MYFSRFPNIYYEFDIGDGAPVIKAVKDITTNVRVRTKILENITLFDEYDIREGETPEMISDRIYGSPSYHWVVMLCNQKFNYLTDFPMPHQVFIKYVQEKYGDTLYDIKQYEKDGFVVMQDVIGSVPITNYDWEERENDKRRRIKLISPRILNQILNEFKTLI